MQELHGIIRAYLNGRLDLEAAAAEMAALWDDPVSGGWGFYLDVEGEPTTADEQERMRALVQRLQELLKREGPPQAPPTPPHLRTMQTIFPILRYHDARGAIRWLCEAFGFIELFSVPESGTVVRHAQLRLGTNLIMLGSGRPHDVLSSPQATGAATQGLYVHVEDLDGHFARARAAGATIASPPADTDFGSREYHARDLEGHPWTFGTYLPDAAP